MSKIKTLVTLPTELQEKILDNISRKYDYILMNVCRRWYYIIKFLREKYKLPYKIKTNVGITVNSKELLLWAREHRYQKCCGCSSH